MVLEGIGEIHKKQKLGKNSYAKITVDN